MNMFLVTLVVFLGVIADTIVAAPTFDTQEIHERTTTATAVDIFNGSIPEMLYPGQNRSAIYLPDGQIVENNMKQRGEDSQAEDEPFDFVLTMGTVRQHVGYTFRRDLPETVRATLIYLCTQRNLPGQTCSHSYLTIRDIAYNAGEEAYIKVGIESDNIPEPPNGHKTDLLNLFIDQLVDAFRAAIGCNKNRYQLGSGIHCREFANSAEFYQVGIHKEKDFLHLKMTVEFNGKTDEGQFDCLGSQTSVWGTIDGDKLKKYANLMGHGVRASVRCATAKGEVPGYPTGTCNYAPAVKPGDLTCDIKYDCPKK